MEIGKRIRQLRLQAGLTQEELANRADLTKGFISQVESDTTSPSIATLADLVRALGTSLAEFFQDPPDRPRQVVFGKEDWVVSGASEKGFELTFLIPEAHGNEMEPVLITLEPGRSTTPGPAHEGEEFGFVLSGQVELRVGDTAHRVRRHECFYYPADAAHRIVNTGKARAQLLWVSCPPSF